MSVMFTARISEEEEEFLKALGDGNRSAGFKILLSRAMGSQRAPAQPTGGYLDPRIIKPTPGPELLASIRAAQNRPMPTQPEPQSTAGRRFVGKPIKR